MRQLVIDGYGRDADHRVSSGHKPIRLDVGDQVSRHVLIQREARAVRVVTNLLALPFRSILTNAQRSALLGAIHDAATWLRSRGQRVRAVGHTYLNDCLPAGVGLDRIRVDRVLHEALTTGADPLHLTVMFNLAHTTAGRYAAFAQELLNDQPEQGASRPISSRRALSGEESEQVVGLGVSTEMG